MRPKVADSAAFNTQVSILEQLPPHDPLSAHVQVLVVNNQQPPEAHTVLAQAQQRFGSHRSVRFASSPNCNPVYSRLQPCVLQTATVYSRLQPCVLQTATLCTPGCNPVYSRLQPCVLQVRFVAKRLPTPPLKCPGRQGGSGAVTASVHRHAQSVTLVTAPRTRDEPLRGPMDAALRPGSN